MLATALPAIMDDGSVVDWQDHCIASHTKFSLHVNLYILRLGKNSTGSHSLRKETPFFLNLTDSLVMKTYLTAKGPWLAKL